MKQISLILFFCWFFQSISAQSLELARQYYEDAEYEKAASIYQSLWNKNKANTTYLDALTDCYIAMKDYDAAAKVVSGAVEQFPGQLHLRVSYASLLSIMDKTSEANKQYNIILKDLPANPSIILLTARALDRTGKPELAIEVLEKGRTLIPPGAIFTYDLSQLYMKTGQQEKMLAIAIDQLIEDPAYYNSFTSTIQRSFTNDSEYDNLLKVVFQKVQQYPENAQLIELLSWIYIQKKDFINAMRQLKALDIKLGNNYSRVYSLAMTAYNEDQYDVAISGFDYIMDKGQANPYFYEAARYKMKSMVDKSILKTEISPDNRAIIDKAYSDFINTYSETGRAIYLVYDYAEFLMLYHHDLDKAISILQAVVDKKNNNPPSLAEIKIRLADYLLIKGERWDASLLYSQVDKDFKEGSIGQEARFKNARLSYFVGDFDWAQAQFDALKTATTRMISNDAIDLSVFIQENMGMDSTFEALKKYAVTELLIYQNKLPQALVQLDSLLTQYPNNALDDDVLYAKAHIYVKMKEYDKAIACYEKIFTDYKEEIRADNAMYELAQLYDNILDNKEKAKNLYERLFNEYSDSVFSYDARQRFRTLRGDANQ